eukprot:5952533-Pleurochrysis_carterae.AAC.1
MDHRTLLADHKPARHRAEHAHHLREQEGSLTRLWSESLDEGIPQKWQVPRDGKCKYEKFEWCISWLRAKERGTRCDITRRCAQRNATALRF